MHWLQKKMHDDDFVITVSKNTRAFCRFVFVFGDTNDVDTVAGDDNDVDSDDTVVVLYCF